MSTRQSVLPSTTGKRTETADTVDRKSCRQELAKNCLHFRSGGRQLRYNRVQSSTRFGRLSTMPTKFKEGDRVRIVDREATAEDAKSGMFQNHFRGLVGVVQKLKRTIKSGSGKTRRPWGAPL